MRLIEDSHQLPRLKVSGLHVNLGGHPIIRNVSLTLKPGDVIALKGVNGSGKSTLLKAIAGIVSYHKGSITVGKVPIASQRLSIGYVPQHVLVNSPMSATASEVVATGLLGSGHLFFPRNKAQQIQQALHMVGLAHRIKDPIHTFSGGQQQRVLIARALIRTPAFLLLDEPLSGSDQQFKKEFAVLLSTLAQQKVAVLIALHEESALSDLITHTIFLHEGEVAATSVCEKGLL
ncbi:MAG: ATP-binding cassette domain-containing protein [Actinomycetaceae bacterium]|nr:ATP-binding cassette domain-containing protein [Actinomycetaceae bacterium]